MNPKKIRLKQGPSRTKDGTTLLLPFCHQNDLTECSVYLK
ncbi:hypothetical protein MICH65_0041 [Candidatus Chazhemtobacterium aquaticus]|uniref:Uncharacterized protein n=1 Tax=Candidatus Chazhemtobacterium aquaticus TaxID=2715735 RepID=A0A857NAP5_9BACT|nr:hypothetical protein MICH65_0041 [Candidatus Chazhemtobacterium aquaticus]